MVILFENYPKLGKGGMFVFEKSLTHFIRALSSNIFIFKVCLSEIGETFTKLFLNSYYFYKDITLGLICRGVI